MGGFKKFILQGDLVSMAVGFIIGLSFATVVTTFTNWLTSLMPDSLNNIFSNEENSFGAFLNAVIAFVILAAIIYFAVVLPYTRAKEKYFPAPDPGTPEDIELLREIRDSLTGRTPTTTD